MVIYYAIAVGKKIGIFTSWDECSKYVSGFSGSVYKSFAVKSDAEKWLKDQGKKEKSEESESQEKTQFSDEDSTEEDKSEIYSEDDESEEEELPEEEELGEKLRDYILFKEINSLLKGMVLDSNKEGFDWRMEDGSWTYKHIELCLNIYGFAQAEFYSKREFDGKFMVEINKLKISTLFIMITKNSRKRWVDDLCDCLNKKLNYNVERLYIITWGDDVSPDYIINLLSENKYFQNTRILIMNDKKITKHTDVKLFLEEKKSNYKIEKNYFVCVSNISKKLEEKNITLTKNDYIQILDILNEVVLDQKQCEIDRKNYEEIEANTSPEKKFTFYNKPKPDIKINRTKTLEIYTDGSHFKNGGSGRKGFGVYFPKNEGGFTPKNVSIEIDQNFMKSEFGVTETEISNPTMEIAACCYALKVIGINLEKLQDIKEIILYADYEGVQFWLDGTWQIKKPYIKKIVDLIRIYEKKITDLKIVVKYIWMKGHSGNYGNEMADKLAKGLIKE